MVAAGSSSGAAGSSAMHAENGVVHDDSGEGMIAKQRGEAGAASAERMRSRRRGGVGSMGEFATRAFAAYALGGSEQDVVMLGGVHAVAGAGRTGMQEKEAAGRGAVRIREGRDDEQQDVDERRKISRCDERKSRSGSPERNGQARTAVETRRGQKLDEMRDLKEGRDDGGDGGEGGEGAGGIGWGWGRGPG